MPDYISLSEGSSAIPSEEAQVKFSDTINPILSFSNDEIEAMNKDVDEIFESDSNSGSESRDDEAGTLVLPFLWLLHSEFGFFQPKIARWKKRKNNARVGSGGRQAVRETLAMKSPARSRTR